MMRSLLLVGDPDRAEGVSSSEALPQVRSFERCGSAVEVTI